VWRASAPRGLTWARRRPPSWSSPGGASTSVARARGWKAEQPPTPPVNRAAEARRRDERAIPVVAFGPGPNHLKPHGIIGPRSSEEKNMGRIFFKKKVKYVHEFAFTYLSFHFKLLRILKSSFLKFDQVIEKYITISLYIYIYLHYLKRTKVFLILPKPQYVTNSRRPAS
jgi:hypothetical protein